MTNCADVLLSIHAYGLPSDGHSRHIDVNMCHRAKWKVIPNPGHSFLLIIIGKLKMRKTEQEKNIYTAISFLNIRLKFPLKNTDTTFLHFITSLRPYYAFVTHKLKQGTK